MLQRAATWMFTGPESVSPLQVLAWWELRRLPFNVLIGPYGLLCYVLFVWGADGSGRLAPGEDAVEPVALIAAPVVINLLYMLGWLLEVPLRALHRSLSPHFGPLLLKLGIGLGILLISIPTACAVGLRLLR
jgi:hypothetical protein